MTFSALWVHKDDPNPYTYRSPAIVDIHTFNKANPKMTEDDFATILVKGFDDTARIEAQQLEEEHFSYSWREND